MKVLFRLVLTLIIVSDFASCVYPTGSHVVNSRRRGGVAGAAIGGAVNGWEGAAAGALIGGAAGGMAGRARRSYYTGTPHYAPARSYYGGGYYGRRYY